MNVLEKFLSFMKLNDEEDDEYYDDEDELFGDDEIEESPKNAVARQKKNYDDNKSTRSFSSTNKVSPIHRSSKNSNTMKVCVIKPTVVDDAREITETLLSGRTVILNLEGLDLEIAQRIIDFTSGATFAINGNLQKVSNYIFLVTPPNVDISGDLQDLLNSSFDVPSIKTRF